MSLYEEYETYTKKYQEEYGVHVVVLYRCGSFYEIYSANDGLVDIKAISELLNIQVSRRNKAILNVDRSNFNMAGFPMFALKKFVNILVDNNYTVVIVDQVSDPPKPKRAVTEIISPGTKIEDVAAFENNMLMVTYFEEHEQWKSNTKLLAIGVAIIDLTTGQSKITEFVSRPQDPTYALDELYKTLVFFTPKEVVLTSSHDLQMSFNDLVNYLDISLACVHNRLNSFPDVMTKVAYQEQFLRKVFPKHGILSVFEYVEMERMPLATLSYVYMLDFSYKHNSQTIQDITPPIKLFMDDSQLQLSYNSSKQLNVGQLISILNSCITAVGKRAFKDRILAPITSKSALEESYDKVALFESLYKDVCKILANIYDLERLYRKLVMKRLHPADFTQIDSTFEAIEHLSDLVSFEHINAIKDVIKQYRDVLDMQEIQKYHLDNITGSFFNANIHPEIDILQEQLTKLKSCFEVLANNIANSKVQYNDRDGYYIEITAKRWNDLKSELRDKKFKIYEHVVSFNDLVAKPVSSTSSALKITEPTLMRRLNNQIVEFTSQLQKEVLEKYQEFVSCLIQTHASTFREAIKYIIEVDWYSSCGRNVDQFKYVRPIIEDKYEGRSYLQAKQLRHPIIERVLTHIDYIPNDAELGTNENIGMLLYGINSAGKSSISKALGLVVIMAQAGMFVPCSEFVFLPYTSLFTRIPSGDDMMKGQSTFVVEITELRNILKRATRNSLVIGDELASGTESVSALAIVSSGILDLYKKQASFVFATHLHDLPSISHIKSLPNLGIYHLSVKYNPDTQKLIYDRELKEGQGNTLYGLEVCKSLSLGEDFMHTANTIRQELLDAAPNVYGIKQSRYNAEFFIDVCSICQNQAHEVHHIQQQMLADKDGFIAHQHKNRLSNLVAVCQTCHDKIHNNEIRIESYKQTSDGIELLVQTDADIAKTIKELRSQNMTQKAICEQLQITTYKFRKLLSDFRP